MAVVASEREDGFDRDEVPALADAEYGPLPFLPEDIPDHQDQDATVRYVEPMTEDRGEEARAAINDALDIDPDTTWEGVTERLADDLDGVDEADPEAVREAMKDESYDREIRYLYTRGTRDEPHGIRIGLEMEDEFMFWPGMFVTLEDLPEDIEGPPRVYSIASSPHEDIVELAVRRAEGGALTPDLCDYLEEGDTVHVRGPDMQGPYGDFVFDDTSDRDLVFIATGTGDAPLKSMVDYIYDSGLENVDDRERDIWMFVGSPWEDDIPYGDEFEALAAEHDSFHYAPTLSGEEYLTDWEGERDYVQHAFLKYLDEDADGFDKDEIPDDLVEFVEEEPPYDIDARIDTDNIDVYACGIRGMVRGIAETLQAIGVPANHIEEEGY